MYSSNSPNSPGRSHNPFLGRQGLIRPPTGANSAIVLQNSLASSSQMSPGRNRKGSSRSGMSSSSGNRSDGEESYGLSKVDYIQHPVNPSYCTSQSYLGNSMIYSSGSSASLSPYHGSTRLVSNNLMGAGGGSSSSAKTKSLSLLVDRSQEYKNGTRKHSLSSGMRVASDRQKSGCSNNGTYDCDQSLDRQQQPGHRNFDSQYHTISGYGKDRSCEREYPHMGARSLEREHQLQSGNQLRSRSTDHEYRSAGQVEAYTSSPPQTDLRQHHMRDTFILDLQSQVAELNKDCAILQEDLDATKDKLSSTMNSIKTFWSPELKKERSIRKEDNTKHYLLIEQLKMAEIENRQHLNTLIQLEQENRSLRELNLSTTSSSGGGGGGGGGSSHESDAIRKEKERHAREMKLLRKTIEEMELRIETQKRTLSTRDESIKKLMDLLQSRRSFHLHFINNKFVK